MRYADALSRKKFTKEKFDSDQVAFPRLDEINVNTEKQVKETVS